MGEREATPSSTGDPHPLKPIRRRWGLGFMAKVFSAPSTGWQRHPFQLIFIAKSWTLVIMIATLAFCKMRMIFLYPSALWGFLLLPVLYFFNKKFVRYPSIVIPNVSLLKKIAEPLVRPEIGFSQYLRYLSIALLVVASAEPLIVGEQSIIRCGQYAVAVSLICFLTEMLLKNAICGRIP
jgi:hypothetical protein